MLLCDLGASISTTPKILFYMLDLGNMGPSNLTINLVDSSSKKALGRKDDVKVEVQLNIIPTDFIILDVKCDFT